MMPAMANQRIGTLAAVGAEAAHRREDVGPEPVSGMHIAGGDDRIR